jgi:hypothetical protein
MFKRRRLTKFGSPTNPRQRVEHSELAGMMKNNFNRSVYRLVPEHAEKVEFEVQNVMNDMQLKALHNNMTSLRTGGIPLTDSTLQSYEKHYDSLCFFFAHIQDYESLIMLRKEPLESQVEDRKIGHSFIR